MLEFTITSRIQSDAQIDALVEQIKSARMDDETSAKLNITNNNLNGQYLIYLCNGLKTCGNQISFFESIDLSNNRISSDDATTLKDFFDLPWDGLVSLNLSNNPIEGFGLNRIAASLSRTTPEKRIMLQELHIDNIMSTSFGDLAAFIRYINFIGISIRVLSVSNNAFTTSNWMSFISKLGEQRLSIDRDTKRTILHQPRLTDINLARTFPVATGAGAKARETNENMLQMMNAFIEHVSSLRRLNFAGNYINPAFIDLLYTKGRHITDLEITANSKPVYNAIVGFVEKLHKVDHQLETLKIWCDDAIFGDSVTRILKAMREPNRMKKLMIQKNENMLDNISIDAGVFLEEDVNQDGVTWIVYSLPDPIQSLPEPVHVKIITDALKIPDTDESDEESLSDITESDSDDSSLLYTPPQYQQKDNLDLLSQEVSYEEIRDSDDVPSVGVASLSSLLVEAPRYIEQDTQLVPSYQIPRASRNLPQLCIRNVELSAKNLHVPSDVQYVSITNCFKRPSHERSTKKNNWILRIFKKLSNGQIETVDFRQNPVTTKYLEFITRTSPAMRHLSFSVFYRYGNTDFPNFTPSGLNQFLINQKKFGFLHSLILDIDRSNPAFDEYLGVVREFLQRHDDGTRIVLEKVNFGPIQFTLSS